MWRAFADNLRVTLSDLSIARIDTIRGPIKILDCWEAVVMEMMWWFYSRIPKGSWNIKFEI